MRVYFVVAILGAMLLSGGCATLVADKIDNARLDSRFSNAETNALHTSLGITSNAYCNPAGTFCTRYLLAQPETSAATQHSAEPGGQHKPGGQDEPDSQCGLSLTAELKTNHGNVAKNLCVDKQSNAAFRGTVVLLHGHGGDKSLWTMTMAYFRYLGFTVLAPDLPGHGSANLQKGYGVADGQRVAEFIRHHRLPQPVIVAGHSMGALAAVNAAQVDKSVDGLMLLAPVQRFDKASLGVAKTYSPWLSRLTPDSSIIAGAELALDRAGVTLEQTDLVSQLPMLSIPVLVYGAATDPVSNIGQPQHWQFAHVERQVNNDESHLSVVLIGQQQHNIISRWLTRIPGAQSKWQEQQ